MKLLTFLVDHFRWAPFSQTLEDASADYEADEVGEAVVVFLHLEKSDMVEENYNKVFRKTLKHIKWLANKKGFTDVVLHSFTHLGGDSADPNEAEAWMEAMADRLTNTGYHVKITPFGWFSSWDISVQGDSLAKVWKEF